MKAPLAGAFAVLLLLPASARADEAPKEYSPYERSTIDRGLAQAHAEIDAAPEGKIVEAVEVITLDVIEDRDPAPRFLNWFHVTSRKNVIAREVLVQPGERYDPFRVDESARNLRDLPQISLVLCVAVKGSAPDRVRLLVITKDVWSIRLNTNFQFA